MHANSLSAGSIFIKNGTPVPRWFRFSYEEYAGWTKLFDANGFALERTALATGWHFSFVAPTIAYSAWGLSGPSAMLTAVKCIMEAVGRRGFNSFEITQIAANRLFMLYRVRVVANPRHLGPTPFLNDPDPYYYPNSAEDVEKIFWRAAEVQPQIKGI